MSNVRSTGSHREPRGQDIARSVYVAIVLCLAGWTRPVTYAERKPIEDVSTARALLAARMEPIDLQEVTPVPSALVFELPKQLSPTSVRDHTGHRAISHHVGNAEVFDDDHLVFANESSAQLVRIVQPSIGSTSVVTSKLQTIFVPVLGSFLFSGETARESFLARQQPLVMPTVRNLLAGTERRESRDADIDTDRGLQCRQGLNVGVLAEQRDVPAASGIETDRDRGGRDVGRERPTPTDVERLVHLRKRQRLSFGVPTEGAPSELSASATALTFEGWIGCPFLEEVGVGRLKMSEGLLDRNAGHLVEEGKRGLFLPFGERSTLGKVSDRLLALGPGVPAFGDGLVTDEANASKGTAEQRRLIRQWVSTESIASQRHVNPYNRPVRQSRKGFIPALNDGVSTLEIR